MLLLRKPRSMRSHKPRSSRQTCCRPEMMKGRTPAEVEQVVQALASRQLYPSHGSVIDADEAARLGLAVTKLSTNDELWQRLWILRCMYAHDARRAGALKIFEGPTLSNSLRPPPVASQSGP
jgi:hypothetical protein